MRSYPTCICRTRKSIMTFYLNTDVSEYYVSTTKINFNYMGCHDNNNGDWEHNPYGCKVTMVYHDFMDRWDLPPNCMTEGETFFGIPFLRKLELLLQLSSTFQNQFDFEELIDINYTYIKRFGTNHNWLVGESINNSVSSIVKKDMAHITLFFTGTTNPNIVSVSLIGFETI